MVQINRLRFLCSITCTIRCLVNLLNVLKPKTKTVELTISKVLLLISSQREVSMIQRIQDLVARLTIHKIYLNYR